MQDSSRSEILQRLREQGRYASELPDPALDAICFEDPVKQFISVLESVGGTAHVISSDAREQHLQQIPGFADAKTICSSVEGIAAANLNIDAIEDPHQLAHVDCFIGRGVFGVAENAAVWVTDEGVKHRVLYFINQHLVLILPASQIVHNMQQAYARLSFGERKFGTFISGPSKTADIEQSLVIGAHGARSLTVLLET